MPMKAFQLLKLLRLEKRMTQSEVAEKMDVSQALYSQIEQGEKEDLHVVEAAKAVSSTRTKTSRTSGGKARAGRSS
jgi:transcriptional regulator with XRE-family HTH domain